MSLLVRRRVGSRAGAAPGGVKTESGVVTFPDYTTASITHNLGTRKIFGMIWREPNEQNEVITTHGYETIFSTFTTWERLTEIFNGTTLVSNYTSSSTKTAAFPNEGILIGGGISIESAWINQAAAWRNAGRTQLMAYTTDDHTIRLTYIGSAGPYCRGEYHYQIWALE